MSTSTSTGDDQQRKPTGLPTWEQVMESRKPTGPPTKRKRKGSKTRKPTRKHKVRAQLTKHKFVETVDEQHIMEYGLTKDEIMNYRKHRFNIENQPLVEVKMNKSAEMKEEFGTYCGIKKTIKNWLYYV